jgi:hypothetical protein
VLVLLLARDERPPAASARLGPAYLDLGGVQPPFDAFGLGVGEHVLHGARTYPWPVRDRASALGQQRANLTHGPCDGGAVHPEQQPHHCVRQVMAQVDQGGQQTIDKTNRCRAPAPASRFLAPLRARCRWSPTATSQGWASSSTSAASKGYDYAHLRRWLRQRGIFTVWSAGAWSLRGGWAGTGGRSSAPWPGWPDAAACTAATG